MNATFVQDERAHYDVVLERIAASSRALGRWGNKIRIAMAASYTFDPDSAKLISERIYYDQASALAQIEGKEKSAVA